MTRMLSLFAAALMIAATVGAAVPALAANANTNNATAYSAEAGGGGR